MSRVEAVCACGFKAAAESPAISAARIVVEKMLSEHQDRCEKAIPFLRPQLRRSPADGLGAQVLCS